MASGRGGRDPGSVNVKPWEVFEVVKFVRDRVGEFENDPTPAMLERLVPFCGQDGWEDFAEDFYEWEVARLPLVKKYEKLRNRLRSRENMRKGTLLQRHYNGFIADTAAVYRSCMANGQTEPSGGNSAQ